MEMEIATSAAGAVDAKASARAPVVNAGTRMKCSLSVPAAPWCHLARCRPGVQGRRRLLRRDKFGRVELVALGAELAGHADDAVLGALGDLLGREAAEDRADLLGRARAVVDDPDALEDAHAMLVEEAIEQPFR